MHINSCAAALVVLSVAWAAAPLDFYARDSSCSTPDGSGTCQSTSDCTSSGFSVPGYCSGSSDIQCCVVASCSTSSGSGKCLSTSAGCSGGSFIAGACPGPSNIECCVAGGSSPPPSGGSQGDNIVSAAQAEEGLPYVYGGGGCTGPSGGGFDCSGLTQYSICKAVGTTIPRTAADQYAASNGQHLPRDQAEAGDLVFWAEGGDCSGSAVEHVGIVMGSLREGYMVNAATTGTPVREQTIWTSSGGLDICPDAVRFWS